SVATKDIETLKAENEGLSAGLKMSESQYQDLLKRARKIEQENEELNQLNKNLIDLNEKTRQENYKLKQLKQRVEDEIKQWHEIESRILEINQTWRFKLKKSEWHDVIQIPLYNARDKQKYLQQLLKDDS